jgi:hypothetical protein
MRLQRSQGHADGFAGETVEAVGMPLEALFQSHVNHLVAAVPAVLLPYA